MKEVGKTWQLGDLLLAVTKDSEDYLKPRIGQLAVLDTLYTEQHSMGTESRHRDLTAYILSGYENGLLPMIEAGGYNTLLSDQGDEGEYYLVACKPTHKQALNKPTQVYGVKLQLIREPSPPAPVWPGIMYFAGSSGVWRTDTFGVSKESDPTWSQLSNSGISGTFQSFAVDPTNDTGEVWVKTTAGHVYKYNGSTWSTVVTDAMAKAWNGNAEVMGVYNDPVSGYIYVWLSVNTVYGRFRTYRDTHDGNGLQIHTSSESYAGSYEWIRGIGDYNVYNNTHTITYTSNLSNYRHRVTYSSNGTSWNHQTLGSSHNVNDTSWLETTSTDYIYMTHDTATNVYRAQFGVSFGATSLLSKWNSGTNKNRFMVHPEDSAVLRFLGEINAAGNLYITDDRFVTNTNNGQINMGGSRRPYYILPIVNSLDWDMIVYGGGGASSSYPHVIATAYGSTDLNPTGKGGAMAGTSPYTDSIPYTAGGPIEGGVQFLDFTEE